MKKPIVLPMDVRLMQWTATVMMVVALDHVLGQCHQLDIAPSCFLDSEHYRVRGNVTHSNPVTLRANVMPQLTGNFFTLNLLQARQGV
jgi:cell division protein FtsQ